MVIEGFGGAGEDEGEGEVEDEGEDGTRCKGGHEVRGDGGRRGGPAKAVGFEYGHTCVSQKKS